MIIKKKNSNVRDWSCFSMEWENICIKINGKKISEEESQQIIYYLETITEEILNEYTIFLTL